MLLGNFELHILNDGKFWLDGGAMFGVVPKTLWSKLTPSDELNRIELALNTLLIETPDENILVDTGVGNKFSDKDKFTKIYNPVRPKNLLDNLLSLGLKPENINKVILSHLHFDHCGGGTCYDSSGNAVPTFPNAVYIVQEKEWNDAIHPNERTKASYLPENLFPIEKQLKLLKGDEEIAKGIKVKVTGGHTQGHQVVIIESKGEKAIFWADLIPTTNHIKTPYIMGYDLYPLDTMKMKKELLEEAVKENWLCIFEHDPKIPVGRIKRKGEDFAIE